MYEKYTDCPICGEETLAVFDILNEAKIEGYEQQCSNCKNYFLVQVCFVRKKCS